MQELGRVASLRAEGVEMGEETLCSRFCTVGHYVAQQQQQQQFEKVPFPPSSDSIQGMAITFSLCKIKKLLN